MGYDPSDHYRIDRRFGTEEDYHGLISDFHENGTEVMTDFIANHTDDEHPWFQEAISSPTARCVIGTTSKTKP